MADSKKNKNEKSLAQKLHEKKYSPTHLLVLGTLAVIFTAFVFFNWAPSPTAKVVYQTPPETQTELDLETLCAGVPMDEPTETETVTAEEAASLTKQAIEENLVPEGVEVNVSEIVEEGSFYRLTVQLTQSGQTSTLYSYLSMDGKYFYPSVFDMEGAEFLEQAPAVPTETTPEPTTFDAPDAEKPKVEFFVMSFCPYGLQAEQGLKPVYELLGDSVDFVPRYVVYEGYGGGGPDYCLEDGKYCSMHGISELNEDIRQLCIYKYYDSDTFWNYLEGIWTSCDYTNVDECWKGVAEDNGIDVDKIETCFAEEGVDLIAAEKAACDEQGVRGSPSVFVNGIQYSGGRAPDQYKQGICTGFVEIPGECEETLEGGTAASTGQC
jgi:glutaredoxin